MKQVADCQVEACYCPSFHRAPSLEDWMKNQIRRREFITLLGGAAAAWPLAARAQQAAMPVIGFLHVASKDAFPQLVAGFHQGLKDSGYVEGQNVMVEYRWADGQFERLPALAADLVRRQVAVIATFGGDASATAAKAATATIPIVFNSGADPAMTGLVASMARPGGNLTGVITFSVELASKRLGLLHDLVPNPSIIGLVGNRANPMNFELVGKETGAAARTIGLQI